MSVHRPLGNEQYLFALEYVKIYSTMVVLLDEKVFDSHRNLAQCIFQFFQLLPAKQTATTSITFTAINSQYNKEIQAKSQTQASIQGNTGKEQNMINQKSLQAFRVNFRSPKQGGHSKRTSCIFFSLRSGMFFFFFCLNFYETKEANLG